MLLPTLSGSWFVNGKDNLNNYLLRFERYATIGIGNGIRGLFGLVQCVMVRHTECVLLLAL